MRLKPLVLLIDDDLIFRKALISILPRLGVDVKAVETREEFNECAVKFKPDLYLIDLNLGQWSGFELIEECRKSNPKAVILVVSGEKGNDKIAQALEMGASDFILKPFDRMLLVSKLSRYLDTDKLKEQLALSVEPPGGRISADLTVDAKLISVDELGLSILSPHLIPKGTVLRVKTSFFPMIGAGLEEALVCVISNTFDTQTHLYEAYAEFEEAPVSFFETLRHWLKKNQGSPA